MLIRDIIARKGNKVVTVSPGTSVRKGVDTMVQKKLGAVIITKGAEVLGIFTERDNLRITADESVELGNAIIDDHMSKNLVIGLPSDSVETAMAVMTEKRVRHLPIIADGLLVGIVSIGDVVKAVAEKHEAEIHYLKNYISGELT